MFFLLFGFWVLLNGSWTLEIALIGLVVSAALYAFIVKFMGYSPKKEWAIVRRLPRIIGYFLYLVKEVFLSAWATIKLVWSPKLGNHLIPHPCADTARQSGAGELHHHDTRYDYRGHARRFVPHPLP